MQAGRFRRLPVVSDGELVGRVSIKSAAKDLSANDWNVVNDLNGLPLPVRAHAQSPTLVNVGGLDALSQRTE